MNQEPKKDKEYSIGFLIFLILSATVIGVLFINSLNCCIPEKSKFNSEVWGTVSDWFTYLVALIGGVFIYKTLNSQMLVQRDQNKIFKIEELKYLRDIKPKITVSTGQVKKIGEKSGVDAIEVTFNIFPDKDTILDVNISTSFNKKVLFTGRILAKEGIEIILTLIHYKTQNRYEDILIEIIYEDSDGNQYIYKNQWFVLDTFSPSVEEWENVKTDKLFKSIY